MKKIRNVILDNYFNNGFFVHYTEEEIKQLANSKRIVIDGVNTNYYDYISEILEKKSKKEHIENRIIYIGKVGKKLSQKISKLTNNKLVLENYNLAIGTSEILHAINRHGNEAKKEQISISKNSILNIPSLLVNTTKIRKLGLNKNKNEVYSFISKNVDGTYNLLEFIGNKRHVLGFASMYIIKKAPSQTNDV